MFYYRIVSRGKLLSLTVIFGKVANYDCVRQGIKDVSSLSNINITNAQNKIPCLEEILVRPFFSPLVIKRYSRVISKEHDPHSTLLHNLEKSTANRFALKHLIIHKFISQFLWNGSHTPSPNSPVSTQLRLIYRNEIIPINNNRTYYYY